MEIKDLVVFIEAKSTRMPVEEIRSYLSMAVEQTNP
jgi:hypothetical protein